MFQPDRCHTGVLRGLLVARFNFMTVEAGLPDDGGRVQNLLAADFSVGSNPRGSLLQTSPAEAFANPLANAVFEILDDSVIFDR